MRPRLLDLFCGAGGAAMGYHRAGFEVVGVDINPQPHYPFKFVRGDALEIGFALSGGFEAIHASPPCQRWSDMTRATGKPNDHPDLIAPTRKLLEATRIPWVIENVEGSPLVEPITLCGSMFGIFRDGGYLRRHRLFESNVQLAIPKPCLHRGRALGIYGGGGGPKDGRPPAAIRREIMGMGWANRNEVAQAIPPAYTEWVGGVLIRLI